MLSKGLPTCSAGPTRLAWSRLIPSGVEIVQLAERIAEVAVMAPEQFRGRRRASGRLRCQAAGDPLEQIGARPACDEQRQTAAYVRRDDQPARAPCAPAEPEPFDRGELLRAVQADDVARPQAGGARVPRARQPAIRIERTTC